MRRSRAGAGVIVALVLLVPLLLPAIASAADDSYAGTYEGWGKGVDKKGKSAASKVTVWVQDLGDQVRVTMRVARVGITVATDGLEQWEGDSAVTVPIDESMPGVDVSGSVMLERDGEAWILTGSGSGKLLSYEGAGEVVAVRTATGVTVPGLGEQIGDALSAIFGGPPDPEEPPKEATGDKLVPPERPAQVVQVEEASSLDPAEATPPIPLEDVWAGVIAIAILTFLIFGFFVFV